MPIRGDAFDRDATNTPVRRGKFQTTDLARRRTSARIASIHERAERDRIREREVAPRRSNPTPHHVAIRWAGQK
jgi:hypothetical protein